MHLYQDVFSDTIKPSLDVAGNRLVGEDGAVGGNYGITVYGGESGKPMQVLVLGKGQVEIAASQTLALGDFCRADSEGKLIKDNINGPHEVVIGGGAGEMATILVRGALPMGLDWKIGSTDGSGEVDITGMEATGKVAVLPIGGDLGANLVLLPAECGSAKFTVYTRNTNTDAKAALASYAILYAVVALS